MIYDVSHRTDIPAFFWDWFADKLDKGWCAVRHPRYPEKISAYNLDPTICDGFRFLSKDYEPAINHKTWPVSRVIETYPTTFMYTITPYGPGLERHVPSTTKAIKTLKQLADIAGKERMTWFLSPIVFDNEHLNLDFHKRSFEMMAPLIAPYVRRCSIDPLREYESVKRRCPSIRRPTDAELAELAAYMVTVAADVGLQMHACPATNNLEQYGINQELCFTLDDFGRQNDIPMKSLKFKQSGLMHCACAITKDLGCYNKCLHGCAYCYAGIPAPNSEERIIASYDPKSPALLDKISLDEHFITTKQQIYRKR